MLLCATIDIQKELPGLYLARLIVGGQLVGEPVGYERIEQAIKREALRAEGAALFIEFSYSGLTTGSLSLVEAQDQAEALANRLVALCAEAHLLEESGIKIHA